MEDFDTLNRLINAFTRLPSVGKKTAVRFAYSILDMKDEEVKDFADALITAKEQIHYCKINNIIFGSKYLKKY